MDKPPKPIEKKPSKPRPSLRPPPLFPPRTIAINDKSSQHETNKRQKYRNNSVSTTKYNILTFLPKNLFEQFRRVANFYFLCIAVIQLVPGLSPVSPVTSFLPLVVVLAVTAVKEAIEDYRRYLSDKKLNATPVKIVENGKVIERQWKDVAVGDIVQLVANDFFPADMVLLYADNPGGMAYIETSNLDGETNLKIKQSIPETQAAYAKLDAIGKRRGFIKCEGPTLDLYKFEGQIVDETGKAFALGKDQSLLRGCALRNTSVAYGIVIYTGHETKLFLNAGAAPSKRTTLEKYLNKQILLMFLFQAAFVLFSAIASGLWVEQRAPTMWYLTIQRASWLVGLLAYFTFIILYNVMIPISLYVSMEMVKLAQVLFLGQDLGMYYEVNDTPAKARTSNLNEELGQVEYIFSDKTGTLTRNVMEFMKCSIGGMAYGKGITEIEAAAAQRMGRQVEPTQSKIKGFNFEDPALHAALQAGGKQAGMIQEFLTMLAVNHDVIPEADPSDPRKIVYQAASPDELALVLAAKYLGFEFLRCETNHIVIRTPAGREEVYEVLNRLSFTSKRKRSSVIVRTPTGELKLLCKGADNVIKARLDPRRNDPAVLDATDKHLETFAAQGLRTLVLASSILDPQFYASWNEDYQRANLSIGGQRESLVEQVSNKIEQNLVILGCTAIEDKLQQGVPQAIARLEEANIKVWMLTGDKQETAINIGFACNLIDNSFIQIRVNADTVDATRALLTKKTEELKGITFESAMKAHQKYALIIDGQTLGYVFDREAENEDKASKRKTLTSMVSEIAEKCAAVICCRMSPKQKALIVQTVKKSRVPNPITLSIGDGANDVPMIQKAHIGVGISGEEGLQAVRAADFAIAQFRYLERLLLVHGRVDYKRIAKLVLYSFYKNMTFSLTLFWFAIYAGWSGQTLYDSWYISLYNVIFTGAPVIVLAIFDTDVSAEDALNHPKLYMHGQRSKEFSQTLFWLWVVKGVFHSVVCFFLPFFSMGGLNSDFLPNGRNYGLWGFGVCVFYCVILTVTLTLILEHKSWNWLNGLGIFSAYFFLFGFSLIYSLIILISEDMYYVVQHMMSGGQFWFTVILAPVICCLPEYVVNYVLRNYRPEPYHIVQERAHGYKHGDEETAVMPMQTLRQPVPQTAHRGYSFESPFGEFVDNTGDVKRRRSLEPEEEQVRRFHTPAILRAMSRTAVPGAVRTPPQPQPPVVRNAQQASQL